MSAGRKERDQPIVCKCEGGEGGWRWRVLDGCKALDSPRVKAALGTPTMVKDVEKWLE